MSAFKVTNNTELDLRAQGDLGRYKFDYNNEYEIYNNQGQHLDYENAAAGFGGGLSLGSQFTFFPDNANRFAIRGLFGLKASNANKDFDEMLPDGAYTKKDTSCSDFREEEECTEFEEIPLSGTANFGQTDISIVAGPVYEMNKLSIALLGGIEWSIPRSNAGSLFMQLDDEYEVYKTPILNSTSFLGRAQITYAFTENLSAGIEFDLSKGKLKTSYEGMEISGVYDPIRRSSQSVMLEWKFGKRPEQASPPDPQPQSAPTPPRPEDRSHGYDYRETPHREIGGYTIPEDSHGPYVTSRGRDGAPLIRNNSFLSEDGMGHVVEDAAVLKNPPPVTQQDCDEHCQ